LFFADASELEEISRRILFRRRLTISETTFISEKTVEEDLEIEDI